MRSQRIHWLAWGIVGIYAALVISGSILQLRLGVNFVGIPVPAFLTLYSLLGVWVALGALIVARRPSHPVGWLLCIGMALPALDTFTFGYAVYSLDFLPEPLPGTALAVIWLNWSGMPFGIFVLTLIMLLFPDGKMYSPKWRSVPWLASGGLLVYLALKALEPGEVVFSMLAFDNPAGVSPAAWSQLKPIWWVALVLMAACYSAAWWSLILRLRRGPGEESQQVKWIIPSAALFGLGIPIVIAGEEAIIFSIAQLGGAIHMLAVAGIVIGSTFAILNYRLYDIDILINRTLVYGTLTGSLALVYFVLVTALQNLISAVSGQRSTLAVVLSTLAIAALFNPLRGRIQRLIDSRFYRRKYDADRALSAFSLAVRDEVDLEQLARGMLDVVEDALQPESASIWLAEAPGTPIGTPSRGS